MLIRGHLRDLVHALYSHLPANVQGHMSCSLTKAIRDELTNQDHALLISTPAALYFRALALITWHYNTGPLSTSDAANEKKSARI